LSTAGNATINNNGGTFSGAVGGITVISAALGGSATINNNGATVSGATGGSMAFKNNSGAGSATLIANGGLNGGGGGLIQFYLGATGDTARVEVFDNGTLDISGVQGGSGAPGITTGSVEGSGLVFLGAFNLTVGSNDLSTTFSGRIQDGGIGGGTGGSFTKIGTGILTFQDRVTNDYIADTVGLSLVSGSIINLNFSGTPDTIGSLTVDGVVPTSGRIWKCNKWRSQSTPPSLLALGQCK
jgi:hypothetical protein